MTTIYLNGEIVTVDEVQSQAEAVIVKDGRISFVGSTEQALQQKKGKVRVVDLKGKTMLPGFIDPHSHFISALLFSDFINLAPPPIGEVTCIADVQRILGDTIRDRNMKKGEIIIGCSYDNSLFSDGRDLVKDDLDAISTDHLIFAMHQSAHTGVANSAILEKHGINADSPDPEGGVYGRYPGTMEPNGLMEEKAMQHILRKIIKIPGPAKIASWIRKGVKRYASYGITTAQEGALDKMFMIMVRVGMLLRLFKIDIVGYYMVTKKFGFAPLDKLGKLKSYRKRFRLGGAKYFLDGSPQGKTAWLSKPYLIPPEGRDADYNGYPVVKDDREVVEVYKECMKRDMQVLTHTNGDQACEQLITCFETAKKEMDYTDDVRPVMIHAQTVRDDQLDRMKTLKMIPSFFVAHTYFWGDWHIDSVLGEERAYRISPLKSAIERDMRYTVHQDTPVLPPDMIYTLWTAVNRKTRSGRTIGEKQKVAPLDAIRAVTIHAAYQYCEEHEKGSITVGKKADLVILDNNPLTAAPDEIKNIQVLETIKEGKTIYEQV